MFTGLIEEVGKVKECRYSSKGCVLVLSCKKIFDDIKIGASVSVNGACLTVTKILSDAIEVEISNETLSKTNSNSIKIGAEVNLERAMKLGGRLDGHLVTGHIDCFARFIRLEEEGFSKRYYFDIKDGFQKYIVYKGSVSINGVSLTVADKDDTLFSVVLIPSTLQHTNLKSIRQGDIVNIETDILAKYVENFTVNKEHKSNLDENFLLENGFI